MYIKDLQSGELHEYGKDCHDSLIISEDGRTLSYYNLQCGDGSRFGNFRFVNKNGNIPSEDEFFMELGDENYANIGGFTDETQGKTKQGDYWSGWKVMGLELPEVGKDVLICDIDGSIYLTHRVNITKTKVAFYDVWGDKIKNIVAWMPLPKPYKEEAADDREQ